MEEKELIKRVKNSFKAKKSRAEILTGFQRRGYKLAYAEELIKKAVRPKKIFFMSMIALFVFGSLFFSIYHFSMEEKTEISNFDDEFSISKMATGEDVSPEEAVVNSNSQSSSSSKSSSTASETTSNEINYDEIEITEEFILFLLKEIGASSLHKSVLGREPAMMNFYIEHQSFYCEIDKEIEVSTGVIEDPDLEFFIDKSDLIDSVSSNNPQEVFTNSLSTKNSWIEIIASETELFSKGYLELYNSLN